ncbi:hypothetical protein NQ318_023584 [Aromia moschata]|uniref:DDE-1 domain-containing protein n=1 Tax=Aromia moschata TaxID=1265417 RepID=A0AAV8YQ81_9CUCU|nr:hypothetical protein NQ318_023584 [Aromia moschata]
MATNIKRARSSVDQADVLEFFNNVKDALLNASPQNIYNYDETNMADDPGAKKVIVPRNFRRVERVQNYSRSCTSIMVAGNAAGQLLPPMVVYKSSNLYENWCAGGPPGTIYGNTISGWFDMAQFEKWFFKVLLPHVQSTRQAGEKTVVIGDNLASHFAPSVIQAAKENNIYMCPFPANATHLMQPLDVAVFAHLKRKWREILERWRKESRYTGSLPKEQFSPLIAKVWAHINDSVEKNLKSGFRTTGLYPMNPDEVLRKIPGALPTNEEVSRSLDASLVDMLKEIRGTSDEQKKRKRGKKFKPGQEMDKRDTQPTQAVTQDAPKDIGNTPDNDELHCFVALTESPEENINVGASTSGVPSKRKKKPAPKQPTSINITKKALRSRDNTSKCGICLTKFKCYKSSLEWIQCLGCEKWICGICNEASKDPYFVCSRCEDESEDEDDPFGDNSDDDATFNPSQDPNKVKKELDVEKRAAVVTLRKESYTIREIAQKLKLPRSTVSDTLKRFAETGQNKSKTRSGRPKSTTSAEDKFIVVTSKRFSPGRPQKSFGDSSERSKRRKTRDLRSKDIEELTFATHMKLRESGKVDASKVVKDLTRSPGRAKNVEQRSEEIKRKFKNQMGLIVDKPKPGYGNSNDGNTARRFFKNPELSGEITGFDKKEKPSLTIPMLWDLHKAVNLVNKPPAVKNSFKKLGKRRSME